MIKNIINMFNSNQKIDLYLFLLKNIEIITLRLFLSKNIRNHGAII